MEPSVFPLVPDEFTTSRPLLTQAPVCVWPLLLSYPQACRVLGGIGQRSLDALVANGDICVKRIGKRCFIKTESLLTFVRDGHPPKPRRKVKVNIRPEPPEAA